MVRKSNFKFGTLLVVKLLDLSHQFITRMLQQYA